MKTPIIENPIDKMMNIKDMLIPFKPRRKKAPHVFALVGTSGTGKSFRARLVADKYEIDLLVDDGLLIRGSHIIAGKSSKREKNKVTAIKRAIFDDEENAREIREALKQEKFKSILLIGTSEKMVGRITEQLDLPYPEKLIYIEDVATEEDIDRAQEIRRTEDKHVIPVPVLEVKKDPSHRVLDSVKFFLKSKSRIFSKKKMVEKTIVQPLFSNRGRLSISEEALSQMVLHCSQEFGRNVKISKIHVDKASDGFRIKVKLSMPYGMVVPDTLSGLQTYIIQNVERFSGIHVQYLDLTVVRIEKG
jgi:adenylate kinase family enzyme